MQCANPKCNAPLEPNSRFCDDCGTAVSQPSATYTPPPSQPQVGGPATAARMQPSYTPSPSAIRGKIIKVPDATPGIIFVNGQQRPFVLDASWQSPVAPSTNMVVEVELDMQGAVTTIRVVPDSQLAKEQASQTIDQAGAKGKEIAKMVAGKVGTPTLVAIGLLFVSWFFLDYIVVKAPFLQLKMHISFWTGLGWLNFAQDAISNPLELLAKANQAAPSSGIYGFLAIIAMLIPLLPSVWKDKRAELGGLGPLAFCLFLGIQGYRLVEQAKEAAQGVATQAASLFGTPSPQQMAGIAEQTRQAQKQLMDAFSMGLGFYISTLAILYLAFRAIYGYLAANKREAY